MTPQLHTGTYPGLQLLLDVEQPKPKKLEQLQTPGDPDVPLVLVVEVPELG
jgi:hypothetical protein